MTTTNLPLYRALIKLGTPEADAEAAATAATPDESHLATKADLGVAVSDLRAAIADLRSDMLKWGVTLLLASLALQGSLVVFVISRLVKP